MVRVVHDILPADFADIGGTVSGSLQVNDPHDTRPGSRIADFAVLGTTVDHLGCLCIRYPRVVWDPCGTALTTVDA